MTEKPPSANQNLNFVDRAKQMKDRAREGLHSFKTQVRENTKNISIPSFNNGQAMSNNSTAQANTNHGIGVMNAQQRSSSPGLLSRSFENQSPMAQKVLEEEMKKRLSMQTLASNNERASEVTYESAIVRTLREELVIQQRQHDETARVVVTLQDDVDEARKQKEDLIEQSARIWDEQKLKLNEREKREDELNAIVQKLEREIDEMKNSATAIYNSSAIENEEEKNERESEIARLNAKVLSSEHEKKERDCMIEEERMKSKKLEEKMSEEIALLKRTINEENERGRMLAAANAVEEAIKQQKKDEEQENKNNNDDNDATNALEKEIESFYATDALEKEIESLKKDNETLRHTEANLRQEFDLLQSTASTSVSEKAKIESEYKKTIEAFETRLASEEESNKKMLHDSQKMMTAKFEESNNHLKELKENEIRLNAITLELKKAEELKSEENKLLRTEKEEITEKYELLIATRNEEINALENKVKDMNDEIERVRNQSEASATKAIEEVNERSKKSSEVFEQAIEEKDKTIESLSDEIASLAQKLETIEETLKVAQASTGPNLERQIAEKNALKSTLADVRYERDVLANMLKEMKKKVGAYSIETPPFQRAVNDAKKNWNGLISRLGQQQSSSAKKPKTATPLTGKPAPPAYQTPVKLNFSSPAAALTPPP